MSFKAGAVSVVSLGLDTVVTGRVTSRVSASEGTFRYSVSIGPLISGVWHSEIDIRSLPEPGLRIFQVIGPGILVDSKGRAQHF